MPSHAKRTRTRSGCRNCRRKKRKCDESRPRCGTCLRRNETCDWALKLSFKRENAQTLAEDHPSMMRGGSGCRMGCVKILDLTREIIRDYDTVRAIDIAYDEGDYHLEDRDPSKSTVDHGSKESILFTPLSDDSGTWGPVNSYSPPCVPFEGQPPREDSPTSTRHTGDAVANLLYLSQGGGQASPPLGTASTASIGPLPVDMLDGYLDPFASFTTDAPAVEDGIFLPGSAYHSLHSTLRSHLIQEVNSNTPTRPPTPRASPENEEEEESSSATTTTLPADLDYDDEADPNIDSAELTPQEESTLWKNWFDEIAPWLDKFDNARHFQNIIPTMASQHSHLRYAMLALSARQLERKGTSSRPSDTAVGRHRGSLHLYQSAIHDLLPLLPSRTTPVIASCVTLCVLEMLSCSPKAWRRHLDGCASLLEAVGINGFAGGGTERALFWCFARMDVCGALISSVGTLIPVSRWAAAAGSDGTDDLDADVALFLAGEDFADYANYSVYLLAQVIDLLTTTADAGVSPLSSTSPSWSRPPRSDAKYAARWLRLWKLISQWHTSRPPALHAVFTAPPQPGSSSSPFPTVLYSNSAAISSNQLHHTASILMLQHEPSGHAAATYNHDDGPAPGGILWHARQVCAISTSNEHHGAWTNGIQPLWIAGKCLAGREEHGAILDLLGRIERESGWATGWRAEDLKEYWGNKECESLG